MQPKNVKPEDMKPEVCKLENGALSAKIGNRSKGRTG